MTEPYSSGLGGGGYFVYYDAKSKRVKTLDGRETAPAAMKHDAFIDPATGKPYTFTPDLVTSGVSVGVPGTPATWQAALDRWGSMSLADVLEPATALARRGFKVDQTFNQQTDDNAERFNTFTSTRKLFLRHGKAPKVGSVLRNPRPRRHLRPARGARHRRVLPRRPGPRAGQDRAEAPAERPHRPAGAQGQDAGQGPREVRRHPAPAHPRQLPRARRLRHAAVLQRRHHGRRGAQHPRALRPEVDDAGAGAAPRASRPRTSPSPTAPSTSATRAACRSDTLLSDTYAAERACKIDPLHAFTPPVAAGNVAASDGSCATPNSKGEAAPDTEGVNTTNLTVADKRGNVVEYTLTIEQTGGSGIVLPGRGFLLNNELTDFTTVYDPADPNRIEPGKRPRSSMSPTIVLQNKKPLLALGSPGGSTIITTVLEILVNRLDLGMSLADAVAAPRAAPNNTTPVKAEQAYLDLYGAALTLLGHALTPVGAPGTSAAEIGAATAIEFGPGGLLTAAAEPTRRGGGAAAVVKRK